MPINISVDYYNKHERELFSGFPNHEDINTIIRGSFAISKSELLTYMMFTEQDNDRDGYRNYNELSTKYSGRLGNIDDYLLFNNQSIQSRVSPTIMNNADITELLGVSLGLCVINRIHGFTEADWKKIPETNANSTFDFTIPKASTGTNFIQAENKGSVIDNNEYKRSSVSNRYSEIIDKKHYVREQERIHRIVRHQNLYYGTIGVIDTRNNSIAKVWLVDPPAKEINEDPRKYKLLSRLYFYLDEFRNIGVKEKLIKAIEKRINEINESKDFEKFNNVHLDYKYPHPFHLFMDGKNFVAIDHNEAFGRVFYIKYKEKIHPFIYALPRSIMQLIIYQDFDKIMKYEYIPSFSEKKVNVLLLSKFKEFEEKDVIYYIKDMFVFNERRIRYEASFFNELYHSKSGRIFGLLNDKESVL